MDQRYYHSKEFADLASVSVRTLRYYDNVGLLSPAQHTASGHRLYSPENLLDLQHILALKFLGFSLDEIKTLLKHGPERLAQVLAQQKAMMLEKRTQLDEIIQAIEETERLLHTNQCDWTSIIKVIQVIQMGQEKTPWLEKYFTPEQQKALSEISQNAYTDEARAKLQALHPGVWTEADQKRVDDQFRFIKEELGRLVAQNADPASSEAQEVARVSSELRFGFAQGDADIEASVGRWWQGYHALPDNLKPFDMSLYSYTNEEEALLNKAREIYQQRQS